MAISNADRQRAYRQRHLKDVDGTRARINLVVEQDAVTALQRLAVHKGVTQASVLRELILQAEKRATDRMQPEAWNVYHSVTA